MNAVVSIVSLKVNESIPSIRSRAKLTSSGFVVSGRIVSRGREEAFVGREGLLATSRT